MQRIEADVRGLHEKVAVLAAVDSGAARERISTTFRDARTVIIYRGLQAGLTQTQIAAELKARSLRKGAQQQQVSATIREFEDLGFVEKTSKGKYVPTPGWDSFGLEKVLRKTLRTESVDDLT